MALTVYWYDVVCFAIVAVAVSGSLWFLRREGGRGGPCRIDTMYESLLLAPVAEEEEWTAGAATRSHVGYSWLWMSCWRGVNPVLLLVLRLVYIFVLVGLIWWDILKYDWTIFVYYTEWTFALVIFYFALGSFISAHGCWNYLKQSHTEVEESNGFLRRDLEECTPAGSSAVPLTTNNVRGSGNSQRRQQCHDKEQRAGFWGYVLQIVYQTSAGAVVLTDIVFWGLIVPFLSNGHFSLNLLMGCMHSLNAVFLLLDTALNRLPFPMFRMAYFVLWSCAYVVFQWVLHACGFTWWPYPFLELGTPWAPLWYFCMALVHIPCYGFYFLVVKAKNSLFCKLFPNAYIKSY